MGGRIGQSVALNYPRRLQSLALCDTAAAIAPEAQPLWQERIDRVREKKVWHLSWSQPWNGGSYDF